VCDNSIHTGQELTNLIRCPDEIPSSTDGKGDSFLLMQDRNEFMIQAVHITRLCSCLKNLLLEKRKDCLRIFMDGFLFSCFVRELKCSEVFRRSVIKRFMDCYNEKRSRCMLVNSSCHLECLHHFQVVVRLRWPEDVMFDYAWIGRMERLANERLELENLMAWLSTLGGAYSALGDDYIQCAETAGKISMHQLKIAIKLCDPITSAKCKVYFAISLLQQGYLKESIYIIREQYKFATSLHENLVDIRLINMCKGVWAKLQYMYSLKRRSVRKTH